MLHLPFSTWVLTSGAFFSPLICGVLAEKIDFKWGFLAAGIGMIIGLITFVAQKNKLLVDADNNPIGLPTQKFGVKQIGIVIAATALIFFLMNFKTMFNSELDIIGYLIYGAMIAMPLIILTDKSLTKDERDRIMVIFILAFFVIFFIGEHFNRQELRLLFLQTDKQIELYSVGKCRLLISNL